MPYIGWVYLLNDLILLFRLGFEVKIKEGKGGKATNRTYMTSQPTLENDKRYIQFHIIQNIKIMACLFKLLGGR